MFHKLNLQLFADGGGDPGSATGAEATGSEIGLADDNGKGEPTEIVYGKQVSDSIAESNTEDESNASTKTKTSFDDLIKGDYREDFDKKVQSIINKRFKETKGLQEQLDGHKSIMTMLSEKYGVDAKDISSLQKAIEEDDSFYEAEAFEKGLTVNQLKELKKLERENKAFREAEERQEAEERGKQIYSKWIQQGEEFKAKYGLDDFDFATEVQNQDFARLLQAGIAVEPAYMAVHPDRIIIGAMAKTATVVKESMANSIASRQNRPAENGISSSNSSQIFKSDPSALNNKDLAEIRRRVMRGERITW